jgi:hypothetical protein
MRLDIRDGSFLKAVRKVTVDGVEISNVTMVDTDLGAIEKFKTNMRGEILHAGGAPCKEEINGKVQVHFKTGWSVNKQGDYECRFNCRMQTYHNPYKAR